MQMVCPVHTAASVAPGQPALVWGENQLTYAEVDLLIEETCKKIDQAGIRENDRVAIRLEADWRQIVLLFALFRSGVIAVPMSTRFPVARLTELIRRVDCNFIVSFDRIEQNDVKHCLPESLVAREGSNGIGASPLISLDQLVTIFFSSGSTGMPKAVLHSWGNHYYNALGSNENIRLAPGDGWLLSLPLFHVAGLAILFRSFIAGAAVIVPSKGVSMPEMILDERITHVSMVNTQLSRVMDAQPRGTFHHLKAILLGGSALSRSLLDHAWSLRLPVYTTYGMTEMASQVTTTRPDSDLSAWYTSGNILSYRDVDCDGEGQIRVRGATRFVGYIDDKQIARPFDKEGWFSTGDLGEFDDSGRLKILGRKDNMFISGGENIHPEEIERALETHAAVKRAIVVPAADRAFGFRPVAFVEVRDPPVEAGRLNSHISKNVARFMLPIAYFEMPAHTGRGMKVSRDELKRRAASLMGNSSAGPA